MIGVQQGRAHEGGSQQQERVGLAAVEAHQGDGGDPQGQGDGHALLDVVQADAAHPARRAQPGGQRQAGHDHCRIGGHPAANHGRIDTPDVDQPHARILP